MTLPPLAETIITEHPEMLPTLPEVLPLPKPDYFTTNHPSGLSIHHVSKKWLEKQRPSAYQVMTQTLTGRSFYLEHIERRLNPASVKHLSYGVKPVNVLVDEEGRLTSSFMAIDVLLYKPEFNKTYRPDLAKPEWLNPFGELTSLTKERCEVLFVPNKHSTIYGEHVFYIYTEKAFDKVWAQHH